MASTVEADVGLGADVEVVEVESRVAPPEQDIATSAVIRTIALRGTTLKLSHIFVGSHILAAMKTDDIAVDPSRSGLYTARELLGAFDPKSTGSYCETLDFRAYRTYVENGRTNRVPHGQSIARALHDNSITQALNRFTQGRMLVGIMGGHLLPRSSGPYRRVVHLSKMLAEDGFTVASGGGPGAMEATHVGAHLAGRSTNEVDAAMSLLASGPSLPSNLDSIVADDGSVDREVITALHEWQRPAFEVARAHPPGAQSLAIPTWHYGHEPPTPVASHIAKYFQNSIREEGLLALAKWGIIFTEGKAGTIQEIFQDAAQNYYRSFDWFSPMVLLGVEYWTKTLPVVDVLRSLFDPLDQASCLTVTDDIDEAADAIRRFVPRR